MFDSPWYRDEIDRMPVCDRFPAAGMDSSGALGL
jgi:hypothetical protein